MSGLSPRIKSGIWGGNGKDSIFKFHIHFLGLGDRQQRNEKWNKGALQRPLPKKSGIFFGGNGGYRFQIPLLILVGVGGGGEVKQ